MLEHESFTDLLLEVSHLSEELENRSCLIGLPATDLAHLQRDIKRVYGYLVSEWLDYMLYLKSDYPHLFSLAREPTPSTRRLRPLLMEASLIPVSSKMRSSPSEMMLSVSRFLKGTAHASYRRLVDPLRGHERVSEAGGEVGESPDNRTG